MYTSRHYTGICRTAIFQFDINVRRNSFCKIYIVQICQTAWDLRILDILGNRLEYLIMVRVMKYSNHTASVGALSVRNLEHFDVVIMVFKNALKRLS